MAGRRAGPVAAAAIAISRQLMIICSFCPCACGQPWSCRKVMVGQALRVDGAGTRFSVRDAERFIGSHCWRCLLLAPSLAGCSARRCVRPAVEGCGLVFALRPAVHPKRFDRNAAADARTSRSRRRIWSAPTAAVPGMAPPRAGGRQCADRRRCRRAAALDDGNGGAWPHRMRRRARHRRARQRQSVQQSRAATGSRSSPTRRASAPESTPSPRDA